MRIRFVIMPGAIERDRMREPDLIIYPSTPPRPAPILILLAKPSTARLKPLLSTWKSTKVD